MRRHGGFPPGHQAYLAKGRDRRNQADHNAIFDFKRNRPIVPKKLRALEKNAAIYVKTLN